MARFPHYQIFSFSQKYKTNLAGNWQLRPFTKMTSSVVKVYTEKCDFKVVQY